MTGISDEQCEDTGKQVLQNWDQKLAQGREYVGKGCMYEKQQCTLHEKQQ